MSVDLYFAAPLIVNDVSANVREAIRAKVWAYLESEKGKRDVVPAPEESVATSYYSREASILVDAKLDELEAIVLATAKSYLEKTLKLPPRHIEVEQAFINVFEPGAMENQHTHDGSLLSCAYYVEAPEDCGCIGFPDPIAARRSYREFTQTTGTELMTRSDIAVAPQPGRFVMFESWMPHYIQCNKSDKVRISIAINLRGIPEEAQASPTGGDELPARATDSGEENTAAESAVSKAASLEGKPFLFNDLFAINPNFGVIQEPIHDEIPMLVIEDLLKHPEEVRDVVGRMPATNWKHEQGGRNFIDYYDCRLRLPVRYPNSLIAVAQQAIQKVYGIATRPADASVDVNWFMQINEKRADFAVPHADMTEQSMRSLTCVLYLNRLEECSGGTAFFRFKQSNSLLMDEAYARAGNEDPKIGETGLDYWPEATTDEWERVGAVDMMPGRMLIFPSQYFHSAYHPKNSFHDFPRMTLAFWMLG